MDQDQGQPEGEAALRTFAMPADANPSGDIFGGWLLSQMDLAGGAAAVERACGRVATIAIEAMKFHKPVMIGDEVSCYCRVLRIGRTSIAVKVETWTRHAGCGARTKVTEGVFTYVALDSERRPRPIEGS
jgi:acyl-CoA thioesterase YciA